MVSGLSVIKLLGLLGVMFPVELKDLGTQGFLHVFFAFNEQPQDFPSAGW